MNEVIEQLDAFGITGVRAEYWIATRIAFESGDRIAVLTGPSRIPGSEMQYAQAQRKAQVYQHDDNTWNSENQNLNARGISTKVVTASIYRIVVLADEGYDPAKWRVTACNSKGVSQLFDRHEFTRWSPQAIQKDGQWFEIDMGKIQPVGAVGFLFGEGDEPEDLVVEVSEDAKYWTQVYRGAVETASWSIGFAPQPVRYVRVSQKGQSRFSRWWSVYEVYLFPRAQLTDASTNKCSFVVRASCGRHAEWAVDGLLDTRWTTETEQSPGQWLDLDMRTPRNLKSLHCLFGGGDEPLRLKVIVSVDGRIWRSVFEGEDVKRDWTCPLDGNRVRFIRLIQTSGPHPHHLWWSVYEISVDE
jgi:hypothetical protein